MKTHLSPAEIKRHIRDVPDFPKPGVLFRDITPLLADEKVYADVVSQIGEHAKKLKADVVVGIESRGFLFGAPAAIALELPFVPVRKPGKLPGERMSLEYQLEYGKSQLDIHRDALKPGQRAVVVDDLLATGGTASAAAKLIELVGGAVAGLLFVVELKTFGGRDALKNYPVESLISY